MAAMKRTRKRDDGYRSATLARMTASRALEAHHNRLCAHSAKEGFHALREK